MLRSGRAAPSTPADFSDADLELIATLDNLDGATNYATWIFDLVRPALGAEVLEVGAGHGTFTERLADGSRNVVATDLSARCVGMLEARYSADPRVDVVQGSLDAVAGMGPFDSAVLINVLEHIEDDEQALRQLAALLKPGGRLVLWVPAFPLLYSEFDRRIGHQRRYHVADLRSKLTRAGYNVGDIHYVNAVGAVAWLVLARLLRRTPTAGGPVRVYDRYFVRAVRWVEGRYRPPFGQSVFAVAVRPVD